MNRQPMPGGNGFAVSRNLNPNLVRVESLKPLGREPRKHPPSQIRKLQASIEQFGFVLPVVIDVDGRVIAGWALVLAAKKLGLTEVPAVTIADLDEAKLRMLRLALNRLGEDSSWNLDALKLEFSDILDISSETDLRISGFEMGEIDVAVEGSGNDEEDILPVPDETSTPVTQLGDLWLLGEHRILCADALMGESYVRLLGDERAQMVFTDPPWNIPIAGHVSGLGAVKHDDFAMGCGEMSAAEFEAFLRTTLGHAVTYSDDGSIHFVCMHWAKSGSFSAALRISTPRQKTFASGAKRTREWGRCIGRGTNSYLCSRREPRRTSTISNSAASVGTDRTFGNMAAKMSSMAPPKASCRCTPRPNPSPSSLTRFGTALIVMGLSSILSGAPARP